MRAVADLLRSSTRASDALGTLQAGRLLVLLPHTPLAGARVIARRMLASCHALEFRGDGRSLRASLSISLAAGEWDENLAALTARAERALAEALEAGGDRVVESEVRPRIDATLAFVPAPGPSASALSVPRSPLPSVDQLGERPLADKVKALLELSGAGGQLPALEREILRILEHTVAEIRRPRVSQAEVRAEIRVLEARIQDLKRMLSASEDELARMLAEKSLDPGVASIYRTVQGLDRSTADYAKKKELLAVIYKANVELLRELGGQVSE